MDLYLQGIYSVEMIFQVWSYNLLVQIQSNDKRKKLQAEMVEERFITLKIRNKMCNLSTLLKTINYICKYISERSLRKSRKWLIKAGIFHRGKKFGF